MNNHSYQFKDVAPAFPLGLKQLDRWIVRKVDKHPYSPFEEDDNLGPIDPHDEKYQADYDTALGALEETTRYSGLGFVFNYKDGLTGVDFDDCVDVETRQIRPDVQAILTKLESYAEFSPSGTGVHCIVAGWRFPIGPAGQEGAKVGKAEIYSGKRYFTVTGDHVPGTPIVVASQNLDWLHERIVKNREFAKDTAAKSIASESGKAQTAPPTQIQTVPTESLIVTTKLELLMSGTITSNSPFVIEDGRGNSLTYESQSEADMALATLLAMRHDDPDVIESEFEKSSLMRSKWEREDYRNTTIQKAIESAKSKKAKSTSVETEDDGVPVSRPKLLTEVGNARRLIEAHGKSIRYCYDLDSWYIFDGKVWVPDRKSVLVQDLMKQMLIRIQEETGNKTAGIDGIYSVLAKVTKSLAPKKDVILSEEETAVLTAYKSARPLLEWAKASESNQKIRGAVEQAKSEGLKITKSHFDSNKMLCNIENGALIFHEGEVMFRKHLREDLCTRRMPVRYAPDADCPQFKLFINWMFPDSEVRDYVLTFLALSLTGLIVRAVLILYGEGANGKSTLMKVMHGLFGTDSGQYSISVAFSTFSVGREESAGGCRADLIPLDGPRLITASESNKSNRGQVTLDMARLKELTGGDLTVARGVYAPEPKLFYNQGKIILATNNLPKISDDSDGAWDRLKLVECKARVEETDQDEHLSERLAAESPGILNLLIGYLKKYMTDGFAEPGSVAMATEAYRGAENHINRFILEHAEIGRETMKVPSSEFYCRYKFWCGANGEEPESQKSVTQFLERRLKVKPRHTREGNFLFGIKLNSTETSNEVHDEPITFN